MITEMLQQTTHYKNNGNKEKVGELWEIEIIKRSRKKQQNFRRQTQEIDAQMQQLLGS